MHLCCAVAAAPVRGSAQDQEVADLRVNNEALLCMLERERQHSQQLAQTLQQAQADALEVSPAAHSVSCRTPHIPVL